MSRRKKKLRRQVIDQMFSGAISVPEARARWASLKTGTYRPPSGAGGRQAMAVKSAAATGYERYYGHPDPQVREWAYEAAQSAVVTKGLSAGRAPGTSQPGTVRAMVRRPGPDGVIGWQRVGAPARPGPPVVPPGVAGR